MSDIKSIPTAADKASGAFEELRRTIPLIMGLATEVAVMRKKLYDEYVKVGFTPEQALVLCRSITL